MSLKADFKQQIRRKEKIMPGEVCEGEVRFNTGKQFQKFSRGNT